MFDASGPQKKKGGLAPLFDRLVNHHLEVVSEDEPYGFISVEEQKQSIIHELSILLNTRASSLKEKSSKKEVLLPYGVPSHFGGRSVAEYNGASKAAWPSIARELAAIIERFEPRLKKPLVTVESYDEATQSLQLSIVGTMQYGVEKERIAFPLHISMASF